MRKIVNKICAIILFIRGIYIYAYNINDCKDEGLILIVIASVIHIINKIDDINERIDNLP